MITATFRIGEDITIALDAVQGDVGEVASLTAKMQRSISADSFAPARGSVAIPFAVGSRPASGDIPAGWNLTLSAEVTADLAAGIYAVDAKATGDSDAIELTDETLFIRLTQAVI